MPTIRILGRVLPESCIIDMQPIETRWIERGKTIRFRSEIRSSIVCIDCTIDEYDLDGDNSYYVDRASKVADSFIDAFGFIHGIGISVKLDSLIKPDGTAIEVIAGHSELSKLCTAFPALEPEELQIILIRNPFLAMAVHELMLSLTTIGNAPLHCGRALESLRGVMWKQPDPSRLNGWKHMQAHLNLDKSYLSVISANSTDSRHGNDFTIDPKIVDEVLKHSWTVFNRYFEYLKRGGHPLSSPDFPRLFS